MRLSRTPGPAPVWVEIASATLLVILLTASPGRATEQAAPAVAQSANATAAPPANRAPSPDAAPAAAMTREQLLQTIENSRQGPKVRSIPADELGFQEGGEVAGFAGEVLNTWSGYVDGRYYRVEAGYAFKDPRVGVVIVVNGSAAGRASFYATPGLTGPAYIASAKDGVLTVKTRSGQFLQDHQNDSDDANRFLDAVVPGGAVYHFDLRKEQLY